MNFSASFEKLTAMDPKVKAKNPTIFNFPGRILNITSSVIAIASGMVDQIAEITPMFNFYSIAI